jgi:hypothetical protein
VGEGVSTPNTQLPTPQGTQSRVTRVSWELGIGRSVFSASNAAEPHQLSGASVYARKNAFRCVPHDAASAGVCRCVSERSLRHRGVPCVNAESLPWRMGTPATRFSRLT